MVRDAFWLLISVTFAASSANAHSSELVPGAAGVPASPVAEAEQSCVSCHAGAEREPRAGRIELNGAPERYVPGRRYTLDFAIRHPERDRLRWGFVVTAVSAKTLLGAGRLRATDLRNTQIIRGTAGREYVTHTYTGSAIGKQGGQHWRFEWVAPVLEAGEVAFYAAGVAADADGTEAGDLVFTGVTVGVMPAAAPGPESRLAPEAPSERE